MKLHAPFGNFRGNKILVTAQYGGVTIETPTFDESFTKNKTFVTNSPLKKLPVLETSEGWLFETGAITRYVARIGSSDLYTGSPAELAVVDNWLDLIQTDLEVPLTQWLYTALGQLPHDPAVVAAASADVKKFLFILEQRLKLQPYIAGERLTLADVSAANTLLLGFKLLFDEKYRKPLAHLTKWFTAIVSSDPFLAVWGPTKLAKVAVPLPEPKAKAAPEESKKPAPAKKEAVKKEAVKKEEAEKEEVKKPEAAPEDDEAPKKKAANPLDLLPPSPFVLDEWKKLYANTKDKASTLPWFWEHYDPAGYSIWKFKYNKLPGECRELYRTSNLLNGFLQRMEEFRKYSFGYLGVYGVEPELDIAGVFLWRGTEIAEEMKEHPQIEGYTITKIDTSAEEHKALVNEYWGKTEENDLVEGQPVVDGKYWK